MFDDIEEMVLDREKLIEEVMILLPALWRGIGKPGPAELRDIPPDKRPTEAQVSPGHVQVMIALGRGPHSVGQLAEAVGVSRSAVTQLVDRLVEHGMVERRHDEKDRRVVFVDFVPETREVARRIVDDRRSRLEKVVEQLTDSEAEAFLKGLKLLVGSMDNGLEPDVGCGVSGGVSEKESG